MFIILLLTMLSLAFGNLEETIKQELHRRFGDDVKLLNIKPLGRIEEIQDITLDVEYGRFKSIAYVVSKDREVKVVLDVLWRLKVYKAKENIPKGSYIDASMFEEHYMWVKSIPSDLRIYPEDFPNYVTATNILKGTYLRHVYLRPVPAVSYGETLKCIYKDRGILVEFSCKALDTGSIGKVIRVKPEGSQKTLRAKIRAKGEVDVLP